MKKRYLLGLLLLAGCSTTPTSQVSTLGTVTSDITVKVDAVIDEYNHAALERQLTNYAAIYRGKHAKDLTSEVLQDISLPVSVGQKKTFAIYQANQGLGAYAKALSEVATAASQADIDLASADLYGSMVTLNDRYETIRGDDEALFDDETFALFSSVFAAVEHALIEDQRTRILRTVVTQADPMVSQICDVIIEQLKSAGMDDAIIASRQYVLTEEISDYQRRAKEPMTLDERRTEMKRLYGLLQDVQSSRLLVQQAIKSVGQVKKSHAVLAKALEEKEFSSSEVAATIGKLKEMRNHYRDFESLLLSCEKITKNDQGILSCEDTK
ncbi:hypothetical protein VIM7927_03452 [Vibrio mangrovi]|nr:hypothetical protein VIM7927_03452 [Vibrio mangrovi]